MYEKNLTRRLTLRMTEKQYANLTAISDVVGVTPSDYLRMCLNALSVTLEKEGISSHEDDKTDDVHNV